jgi:hypothetical protein
MPLPYTLNHPVVQARAEALLKQFLEAAFAATVKSPAEIAEEMDFTPARLSQLKHLQGGNTSTIVVLTKLAHICGGRVVLRSMQLKMEIENPETAIGKTTEFIQAMVEAASISKEKLVARMGGQAWPGNGQVGSITLSKGSSRPQGHRIRTVVRYALACKRPLKIEFQPLELTP